MVCFMCDVFENRLMLIFFVVIVVNLVIGVVSKIFVENLIDLIVLFMDIVFFDILVVGVNILVVGLFVGKKILIIGYCCGKVLYFY